jgi:hypothetical protein
LRLLGAGEELPQASALHQRLLVPVGRDSVRQQRRKRRQIRITRAAEQGPGQLLEHNMVILSSPSRNIEARPIQCGGAWLREGRVVIAKLQGLIHAVAQQCLEQR